MLFSKAKQAEPLWQKMKALADGSSQTNMGVIFCALYGLRTSQLAEGNARAQTAIRVGTNFPTQDSSSYSCSSS